MDCTKLYLFMVGKEFRNQTEFIYGRKRVQKSNCIYIQQEKSSKIKLYLCMVGEELRKKNYKDNGELITRLKLYIVDFTYVLYVSVLITWL